MEKLKRYCPESVSIHELDASFCGYTRHDGARRCLEGTHLLPLLRLVDNFRLPLESALERAHDIARYFRTAHLIAKGLKF